MDGGKMNLGQYAEGKNSCKVEYVKSKLSREKLQKKCVSAQFIPYSDAS